MFFHSVALFVNSQAVSRGVKAATAEEKFLSGTVELQRKANSISNP